jgi:hypothetical protein
MKTSHKSDELKKIKKGVHKSGSLSFCTFSFGRYVVCSSIHGFWLPLWYLQTLLMIIFDKLFFFQINYIIKCWMFNQYISYILKGDENILILLSIVSHWVRYIPQTCRFKCILPAFKKPNMLDMVLNLFFQHLKSLVC